MLNCQDFLGNTFVLHLCKAEVLQFAELGFGLFVLKLLFNSLNEVLLLHGFTHLIQFLFVFDFHLLLGDIVIDLSQLLLISSSLLLQNLLLKCSTSFLTSFLLTQNR